VVVGDRNTEGSFMSIHKSKILGNLFLIQIFQKILAAGEKKSTQTERPGQHYAW
jgi:hypothetical protein